MSEAGVPRREGEFAFCGACGARIEASSRFCTSCGESQEQFLEQVDVDDPAEARTAILSSAPPTGRPLSELPPPSASPAVLSSMPSAPSKEGGVTGMVVVGYACAFVLPLIGAVVGGALHRSNRHGIRIVVLSLAMMALFVAVAVALLVVLGVEVASTSTL